MHTVPELTKGKETALKNWPQEQDFSLPSQTVTRIQFPTITRIMKYAIAIAAPGLRMPP